MDDISFRGHAIVRLDDGRIVLLREVSCGSVRYVAPGVPSEPDETPGQAAARAAVEQLGIDVEIAELVFAATELGSEHFYFLAAPTSPIDDDWDGPASSTDGVAPAVLRTSTLLAYPVRPSGLCRSLHRLTV